MHPFFTVAFDFINFAIMPLWFGLLCFPRRRWVSPAIDAFTAVAAVIYVVDLVPVLPAVFPVVLRPTLASVGELMATPRGTVGAWTHFVIGDLWFGRWIVQDAFRQGIPHLWIVPILVLTLLFGPAGLLSYFLLKRARRRRFGTVEE